MTNARERAMELIAGADNIELIGLLAIGHVITGKETISAAENTKGTLKKAIKRLREAQARHPEMEDFEKAIQYIQQII